MSGADGLVFDLDGVLVDSEPAIRASLDSALQAAGEPATTDAEIRAIIGPPLGSGLTQLLEARGRSEIRVDGLLADFRGHYAEHGPSRTRPYEGILEVLASMADAGFRLAIATSKPRQLTLPILAEAGLREFFAVVGAPDLAAQGESKLETLGGVLEALDPVPPATFAMVGDRGVDMSAAVAHGLLAAGACWGYGSPEELQRAGAQVLLDGPGDLHRLVERP